MTADDLRKLIAEAAAADGRVGPLVESVKWGEASFAPQRANTGSSVRIRLRDSAVPALMFICTTGLVDEFRTIYGDTLTFEGNRALVIDDAAVRHRDAVKHCVVMTLTHKLPSRATRK